MFSASARFSSSLVSTGSSSPWRSASVSAVAPAGPGPGQSLAHSAPQPAAGNQPLGELILQRASGRWTGPPAAWSAPPRRAAPAPVPWPAAHHGSAGGAVPAGRQDHSRAHRRPGAACPAAPGRRPLTAQAWSPPRPWCPSGRQRRPRSCPAPRGPRGPSRAAGAGFPGAAATRRSGRRAASGRDRHGAGDPGHTATPSVVSLSTRQEKLIVNFTAL